MYRITLIFAILLVSGAKFANGQDKLSMDGYISDMQTVYKIEDRWLWENTFMDRFNFHVYPTSWLRGSIQFRSRIITGNTLRKIPGYTEVLKSDPGYVDMTFVSSGNLGDSAGYALATTIDRLWLQFSFGNLEIIAGRQRINWGQTFVWNPNDIFNSYSYFEVDYPERPGSDALRLQYYTGNASAIELAAKIDSANRVTAAGYFRFNTLGYDIQLIGGMYQEEDLMLGAGWSGNMGPSAFRGEMSYFRDLDNFSDTTGYFMASRVWIIPSPIPCGSRWKPSTLHLPKKWICTPSFSSMEGTWMLKAWALPTGLCSPACPFLLHPYSAAALPVSILTILALA